MDYFTIVAQRAFYEGSLKGATLDTVRYVSPYALFLGFKTGDAVKLSCTPDMPYFVTIPRRFIPLKHSHDWHAKRLCGSALGNLSVIRGDRVLTFHFDNGFRLIFELTGRNTNIILVDSEGIIAGSIRTVTSRESGFREIMPGIVYIPPPERQFPDIVRSSPSDIENLLRSAGGTIAKSLMHTICASSRLFALEALSRSGITAERTVESIDDDNMSHLLETIFSLAAEIEHGGTASTVVFGRDGIPQNVFPAEITISGLSGKRMDNLNEAVLFYARTREVELERKSLRNAVLDSLKREERRIASTILKVTRECGEDDEPEKLERIASTILANLRLTRKGMSSAVVNDPYGSGFITIELEPSFDGPGNAEKLFTRARKLRAASRLAEERLATLGRRLERNRREQAEASIINDITALKHLAGKHTGTAERQRGLEILERFPRRFTSVSGLEIIVGRSDEENDELVRWARKNDYWLHAQNSGGSHIIIRSPGRQTPDWMSIEQAASIAAYYSKEKHSGIVPVVCTPLKYVVKRKGQGPGKVTYSREKVIFAKPGLPESPKTVE